MKGTESFCRETERYQNRIAKTEQQFYIYYIILIVVRVFFMVRVLKSFSGGVGIQNERLTRFTFVIPAGGLEFPIGFCEIFAARRKGI